MKGLPYCRTGPSAFVHGPNVVFDTPEESKLQLERAGIGEIGACFYSHWHPDHTMGRRVWETRNGDFRTWPREAKRPRVTDVYLPEQVAADFRVWLGGMAHLEFMRDRGWIRIHELRDGDVVEIGGVAIRPFRLAEDYVYAFELRDGGKRVLVAMDELNGWTPPAVGTRAAISPSCRWESASATCSRASDGSTPTTRCSPSRRRSRRRSASSTRLDARRVVLSHVEEMDGLSHDDLQRLGSRLRDEGRPVTFAYDGMTVDVR